MKENELTPDQVQQAYAYVLSYLKFKGIDIPSVDFDKKPKNLPEDVSRAWDILIQDNRDYDDLYGAVEDDRS